MPRPRTFDEDAVVRDAMDVFWAQGFEGTSLDALEAATGLNRSSLYNTFGGKVELFCKALDAYGDGPCRDLHAPFRTERGAAALLGYLSGLRAFARSPDAGRGCMMVNAGLDSPEVDAVRRRVDAHFTTLRADLRRAFREANKDGSVSADITPDEAADWLLVFARGVLSGAASGVEPRVLVRSIDAARKQLGL